MNEKKSFSLELELNGKIKRYVTPKRIPGGLWRESAMIAEELDSGNPVIADLDSHLQFICDVFGNQFDIGQLEDGIDSRDLLKTVYATTLFVMGQVTMASEMLTHDVDVASIAEINEKKS